jgi:hypothetical protein
MMGLLARFLTEKHIPTTEDRYCARVFGYMEEDVEWRPKITRINVYYSLKIPARKVDDVRQAFAQYLPQCPGA